MMATPVKVRTIDLGYEQMLVLDGGPERRVRVLFGGTWLTEEGLPEDSIMYAGDEVALRGDGKALLEGFVPSRVEILESRPRNALRSVARFVQRAGRGARRIFERLQLSARAVA